MAFVREGWKSRIGFIMATAGFAVGVGNVWRFPYMVGQNGGGAFICLYLILSLLIGLPLLVAEIALGRKAGFTPIRGFKALRTTESKNWSKIAWLSVISCQMITGYYIVIMAWVLHYILVMASGHFSSLNLAQQNQHFQELQNQPVILLLYCVLIAFSLVISLLRGLQRGVERLSRHLLPVLIVLMLILALSGLFLEGAGEGLRWYLRVDLQKLNAVSLLNALGQVLFSIGVGMAVAFTYGSYLDKKNSDVVGDTAWVVAIDAFVAILAGLLLFPALFAFGFEPDSGPGLLFITMASVFSKMPFGDFIGALFFALVFLAGYTSIIGLTEGIVATLGDSLNLSRKRATYTTLAVTLMLAIPSAYSAKTFHLFDFISGNLLLPINALIVCLYVVCVWRFRAFQMEANRGAGALKVTRVWAVSLKWLIPAVVVTTLCWGLLR